MIFIIHFFFWCIRNNSFILLEIKNLIGIGKQIHKTNVGRLIVSVISIVILYCVKKFVNEKFKKRLILPIPIELIVVS